MQTTRYSFLERTLLFIVLVYRNSLSHSMLHSCRFIPTCSEYATEAISRHGAFRGLWLTLRRLSRCHPFGSFGVDPVT